MKKLSMSLLAAVLFSLVAENALALTGNEILKKAEEAMNAPRDRTATEKMILIKADGSAKVRTIRFYQKGNDKRLVIFLSPADVKGVGFLSLSEDRMYLYLPAFRKVRRIASHIKNENFMGTDFSYEDMAETRYTDDYLATLQQAQGKEGPGQYILDLRPRPGADVSYSRQKVWVDKETFILTKTEYYSPGGKLIKVLTSGNIKKVDGYWFPMKMTMETLKTAHRTVLEVVEIKHDSGLADRFFTERNLKRQGR
ncbi:MAG: outer membrane lipoprotein-sorting protein [Deferribacteres bacterium]|nr:outer membrane lipoprotein-sorting protein [Deferribacteres bacterium]